MRRLDSGLVRRAALLLVTGCLPLATATACSVPGTTSDGPGAGAKTVTFEVTGNAPEGVEITYGSDTSNYDGSGPPFSASLSIEKQALFYDVSAQLQGGGDITCKLTIGTAVQVGHAVGSYNICSVQLNRDPTNGGWDP